MISEFRVMIRCPQTGESFDVGIRTTGREVLNTGIYQQGKVSCRLCKNIHSFAGNAFLAVDEIASRDNLWRPNN